eukprot:946940-Alexandrium_andersonii.AAC.1
MPRFGPASLPPSCSAPGLRLCASPRGAAGPSPARARLLQAPTGPSRAPSWPRPCLKASVLALQRLACRTTC